MKHVNKKRKFGRERGQRIALLRSLLHNFIVRKKMRTTEAKAKELKPMVEKMITKARTDTIHNRRLIFKKIVNKNDVKKIFEEIAPRYKNTAGGYTRIIKLPQRKKDAAKMAIIEFI